MTRSKSHQQTRRFSRTASGQDQLLEASNEEELEARRGQPVECLGLKFENDDARRAHFLDKLKAGLQELHGKLGGVPYTSVNDAIARMRAIQAWPMGDETQLHKLADRMRFGHSSKDLLQRWKDQVGFPNGETEDILHLSDPPYYTACPTPFVEDFVEYYGRDYTPSEKYVTAPYATDVSQSRNDPYVNAHSYATKVPPQAVLRYLLRYTSPGDLIYDGYCGTAMTAVAAQIAERPPSDIKTALEEEWDAAGWGKPAWGSRPVIVGDLSPAATFIGNNLTSNDVLSGFSKDATNIQHLVEEKYGWMYKTKHYDGSLADIDVTLWSDVFVCPECSSEIVYWDCAVDVDAGKILDDFPCSQCGTVLNKRGLSRAYSSTFDGVVGRIVKLPKQVPVSIVYRVGGKKFEKIPDHFDLELIRKVNDEHTSVPTLIK